MTVEGWRQLEFADIIVINTIEATADENQLRPKLLQQCLF